MEEPSILKKRKAQSVFYSTPIQEKKFKGLSLQEAEEKLRQKSFFNEKLLLHSIQKHLIFLKLEESLIIIALITAAVLGRILLQGFPSVEPITLIAVLAGSLFGWKKGATTGASSWYLSNFFMFGGQGPWTIIHVANGVLAGTLGGLFLKKSNHVKVVFIMIISTLIFELSMNTMSGLLFYGLVISFITAIPFTITHLTSNIAFSFLLPKARKIVLEGGKLDKKELFEEYIKKLKQKRDDYRNVS